VTEQTWGRSWPEWEPGECWGSSLAASSPEQIAELNSRSSSCNTICLAALACESGNEIWDARENKHLHDQWIDSCDVWKLHNMLKQTPQVARHVNHCIDPEIMLTNPLKSEAHSSGTHAALFCCQQPTVATAWVNYTNEGCWAAAHQKSGEGWALSVGRSLVCWEALTLGDTCTGRVYLAHKACCRLCKLTSRQSRFAIEACGSCVVYNLPLGEATPGNLVLRSAAELCNLQHWLNRRLVDRSFTACKETGAHEHSRKSPPHSSPVLFCMRNLSATGLRSASNGRESPTRYLSTFIRRFAGTASYAKSIKPGSSAFVYCFRSCIISMSGAIRFDRTGG